MRIGADYFSFRIEDAITLVNSPLRVCSLIADAESAPCQAVTRDASGVPTELRFQTTNLAVARVNGVDFNLDFSAAALDWMPAAADAEISLRSLATVYFDRVDAETENTPFFDCAGGFHQLCTTIVGQDQAAGVTFPDKLVTTSLSYGTSRWSTSLRWRWIAGLDSLVNDVLATRGLPPQNLPIQSVSARNYLDVAIRYNVGDNLLLRAGVDNILETTPPLLGDEAPQSNTDPSRYDVLGRRVYFGFEFRFGG